MSIRKRINIVDMEWSSDGDFVIRNGDLSDTLNFRGMGFIQEVEDRVKSTLEDWKLLPKKGANIEEFYGEQNNKKTWKQIETAISFSLTKDGFLNSQDFSVTVAPLSNTEVAARIDFNISLTDTVPDSKIVVKVVYDLAGQGPFIIR